MKGKATYFLLLCWMITTAMQLTWSLIYKINTEAKEIQTDALNNLYLITPTNQLMKFDAEGALRATLNYPYQGNLTSLDASNPMECYLLYRELNRVVFLDNNLAFRGELNLSDAGIIQASAMGRSYSGGVWIFDQGEMKLKKLTKDGTPVQESGNVLQTVHATALNPLMLRDDGNRVMLLDSIAGILVFDVFANYLKTIPVGGAKSFSAVGSHLYYSKNGSLIRYHMQTLQRDTLPFGTNAEGLFCLSANRFTQTHKGEVEVYSIP